MSLQMLKTVLIYLLSLSTDVTLVIFSYYTCIYIYISISLVFSPLRSFLFSWSITHSHTHTVLIVVYVITVWHSQYKRYSELTMYKMKWEKLPQLHRFCNWWIKYSCDPVTNSPLRLTWGNLMSGKLLWCTYNVLPTHSERIGNYNLQRSLKMTYTWLDWSKHSLKWLGY